MSVKRRKRKIKVADNGISEILDTVLLLAIAVALFSVAYVLISSFLVVQDSPQANIIGYVQGDNIILEHLGGDSLDSRTKLQFTINGQQQTVSLLSPTLYDTNNNVKWDVGEKVVYDVESLSGYEVDAFVIDSASNSIVFYSVLQSGTFNGSSVVDLNTSVDPIIPFVCTSSPYTITATGDDRLDAVTLYYAFNSSNWSTSSTQTLAYDDFEEGLGNYSSGGSNCNIYTGDAYAHQGTRAIHIQNNGEDASFYLTNSIDIDSLNYSTITIDFWFVKDTNPGVSRQFTLEYYNGSNWQTIKTYSLDNYNNSIFYKEIIQINETNYTFPTNMTIKFEGAMPNNADDVYFDQIYVNATRFEQESEGEIQGTEYGIDGNAPWSWIFNFSNNTGYYRFYSLGEFDGEVESVPSFLDTSCFFDQDG
jgi:hypothetical protein